MACIFIGICTKEVDLHQYMEHCKKSFDNCSKFIEMAKQKRLPSKWAKTIDEQQCNIWR